MQWGYIALCVLVSIAIFGIIKTQDWNGIGNKATGFLLLLPLLTHAAGAAMTANIGAMHDKQKEVTNNVQVIEDLERQIDSLYIDKKIMQAYKKVTKAHEITVNIDLLTAKLAALKTTQKATIDEKYSGYGTIVINILGGSFGIVALLLEFIFAIVAARCYASANPRGVQYASTQDDTQDAEYEQFSQDDEYAQDRQLTRAEIRAEEALRKKASVASGKTEKDERLSITCLAGKIISDGISNRAEARSEYSQYGYTYNQVDEAWKKSRAQLS